MFEAARKFMYNKAWETPAVGSNYSNSTTVIEFNESELERM